jgi:hypothetical protein
MAARGVAQSKPIVIGVLGSGFGPSSAILIDAFKQGLGENGLAEGRDYVLDVRWAEGDYTRFSALASELTQRKSSLIVVTTIAAARSAQQAAPTTPVVMTGLIDPVGAGLIASLARPGGNTTDISSMSQDVTAKGLELLRVVIPEQRGQSKQHRFSHAGGGLVSSTRRSSTAHSETASRAANRARGIRAAPAAWYRRPGAQAPPARRPIRRVSTLKCDVAPRPGANRHPLHGSTRWCLGVPLAASYHSLRVAPPAASFSHPFPSRDR